MLKKYFENNKEKPWHYLLIWAFKLTTVLKFLFGVGIISFYAFDITPLSFSVFSMMILIYSLICKFVETVSKAAFELYQLINEAVLIIGRKGRIVEYNTAAESYCDDVLNF